MTDKIVTLPVIRIERQPEDEPPMTDSTEADIVERLLAELASEKEESASYHQFWIDEREKVLKLTAERDAAALDMRERCAKVCMNLRHPDKSSESNDWIDGTEACANAVAALPLLATDSKDAT